MAKVIMTNEEYVSKLKTLAERKTGYNNKYPYNLLYVHKDKITGDCLNTIKALLNGYNIYNNNVGYYQRDLSNTGDVSEATLLSMCTDISTDFSQIPKGALLYMRGHVGTFVSLTKRNGKEYNVIECTKSFGGGIVYSWVDADGTRRSHKGGVKNGKWIQFGKMTKFLSYNAPQAPNSPSKPKVDYSKYPTLQMKIDPKTKAYLTRGEYVKIMQKLLKAKGCDPNGIDGIFGKDTKSALKKFQQTNTDINGKKLVVDCICGQKTWGSLYK